MIIIPRDKKSKDQCNINSVSPCFFDMTIRVNKLESNIIEVRDSSGIRIHVLSEKNDKGLWTYFNIRLEQNEG